MTTTRTLNLDPNAITYALTVRQDDCDVRGNAMFSGDDAFDTRIENEIIERLNTGDVWAWAHVTVEARYPGIPHIVGRDMLGCCSYADETDFTQPGGYYDDMCDIAKRDLIEQLTTIHKVLATTTT